MRTIKADVLRYDRHLGYWEAWRLGRPVAHATDLAHLQEHCPDVPVLHTTSVVPVAAPGEPRFTWECTCGDHDGYPRDRATVSTLTDVHWRERHGSPT